MWTGFVPSPLDLGDLHHAVAESGIADHVLLASAAPAASEREKTPAVDAGIAAAAGGGLLVVFNETGHLLTIDQRLRDLAERPGTTIVVAPLQATTELPQQGTRPFLASIAFDATRAARNRWPAISSESWSLVATPQMATIAERARLAMTDELDQYLSQPFHVAEHTFSASPARPSNPPNSTPRSPSESAREHERADAIPTPNRSSSPEQSLTPAAGGPRMTGSTAERRCFTAATRCG